MTRAGGGFFLVVVAAAATFVVVGDVDYISNPVWFYVPIEE